MRIHFEPLSNLSQLLVDIRGLCSWPRTCGHSSSRYIYYLGLSDTKFSRMSIPVHFDPESCVFVKNSFVWKSISNSKHNFFAKQTFLDCPEWSRGCELSGLFPYLGFFWACLGFLERVFKLRLANSEMLSRWRTIFGIIQTINLYHEILSELICTTKFWILKSQKSTDSRSSFLIFWKTISDVVLLVVVL